MELSFFVSEEVLKRMQPDMPRDEAGLLSAFDNNRPLIHAAASTAFTRTRKGSYELTVSDFRVSYRASLLRRRGEPVTNTSCRRFVAGLR